MWNTCYAQHHLVDICWK